MNSDDSPMPEPPRHARFPKTRWSLIRRIGEGLPKEREAALEEVCQIYWPPVYAYILTLGASVHEAQDLTQSFFADLLQKRVLERLDPAQGKLRSYLLQAVRNHVGAHRRREGRQKRGGDSPAIPMDPAKLEALGTWMDGGAPLPPDEAFDRAWAVTVLETAFARLRQRYHDRGEGAVFDVLAPEIRLDAGKVDLQTAALTLGIAEESVRMAAYRLRRRYGAVLRQTVAETLGPDEDVDEELRRLRTLFG